MNFNLLDESTIRSLIADIEGEQVRDRREKEYKSYKVSNGAQKEYIQEELRKLFPYSYQTMRIADISLAKKVISKLSKAYKDNPIRLLDNDEDTKAYQAIVTAGDFNTALEEFDSTYNRQKYALMWVNNQMGKLTLHSLKGFESFVVKNQNTSELELVALSYPDSQITTALTAFADSDGVNNVFMESQDDSSASKRIYAFWTNYQHTLWRVESKLEGKNKRVNKIERINIDENNIFGINPIGKIPFVFISESSSADLPFMSNLSDQSISVNLLMSDYHTATALQGYGQLVVKLLEGSESKSLHQGMTTAIQLTLVEGNEQQPDASFINANPDLAGMKETIAEYTKLILSENGITSGGLTSENFNSGLERLIAQADVQDVISSNQKRYQKLEQGIFDIVVAYSKILPTIKLFKEQKLTVIFSKPKVMISDKETLENIKTLLELGLITKVEALQMIDPNLDEKAASGKLDKIDLEKNKMIDFFKGGLNENTETDNNI